MPPRNRVSRSSATPRNHRDRGACSGCPAGGRTPAPRRRCAAASPRREAGRWDGRSCRPTDAGSRTAGATRPAAPRSCPPRWGRRSGAGRAAPAERSSTTPVNGPTAFRFKLSSFMASSTSVQVAPRPLASPLWDFSSRSRSRAGPVPAALQPFGIAQPRDCRGRGSARPAACASARPARRRPRAESRDRRGVVPGRPAAPRSGRRARSRAGRPGLKLDLLDPEPVAAAFGGEAADLGDESLRLGVQPAVQRRRAAEDHADGQQASGSGSDASKPSSISAARPSKSDSVSSSETSTRPRSQRTWSSRWKTVLEAPIRTDGREQAAFRAGLADVPALHVAGEDDRRVLAGDLAECGCDPGPSSRNPGAGGLRACRGRTARGRPRRPGRYGAGRC